MGLKRVKISGGKGLESRKNAAEIVVKVDEEPTNFQKN
jgi:hypothetical protein